MRQARREYPQLDGIFCTNDDLAVGAAFECQRLGLKIPMIWRLPVSTATISAR
jgi:LacI family gluconate utilization system Gnt-I transcriptional repressor